MTNDNEVRIFLSCPGDVIDDRNKLKQALEEWRSEVENRFGRSLKILVWDEDAERGPGRPQDKINQLLRTCPIYIGLMGKKFGGSTGLFQSGTNEEYSVAFLQWEQKKQPDMRFFFKAVQFTTNVSDEEFEQINEIRKFKKTIQPYFFYDSYTTADDLISKTKKELEGIISKLQPAKKKVKKAALPSDDVLSKYRDYLAKKYQRIRLSQNVDFDLEQVYVSLRLEADPRLWHHLGEVEMLRRDISAEELERLQEVLPKRGRSYALSAAGQADSEKNDLSIEEILQNNHRLMILGEPGSGKTTLSKHLISRHRQASSSLIPVFLPFKFWSQCGFSHPLEAFVHSLGKETIHFPSELGPSLRTQLDRLWQEGKIMLLLDGLDELDSEGFKRACELLDSFLPADQNKILVNCRRSSYDPLLSRTQWQVYSINPFNKSERRTFIGHYFGADETKAENLAGLVEGRSRLRSLGQIPLLLGLICYIYETDANNLPEERVLLYDRCVQELLKRRPDEKFGGFSDLKEWILQRMAYQFFRASDPSDREWLPGSTIRQIIREEMKAYPSARETLREERADEFLQELVGTNGLLLPAGADHFCFPHRSFQEFFAARHLQKNSKLNEIVSELAGDDFWTESICLYAGLLPNATELINELGRRDKVDLALRVMPEAVRVDWEKLDQEKLNWKIRRSAVERLVLPEPDKSKSEEIVDLLRGILRKPDPNANVRYSALIALEKIGTQEAIHCANQFSIIPPEIIVKRLPYTYSSRGREFQINLPGMPPNMVRVPGGTVKLSETSKIFELNDFFLSIFPVTNREFKQFIDAGGYENERYWPDKEDLKQKKEEKWIEPIYWQDTRFNHPWQPVVGVSFYEAAAYCLWLTEHMHPERPFRLPREEEWEYACTGPLGEGWGFGPEWNPDMPRWDSYYEYEKGLTYGPSRVNSVYGQCCSGFGLFDMSGNVWEWTDSWYDKEHKYRVLRGGSWLNHDGGSLRSASRFYYDPGSWGYFVGFRCLQDSR